MVLVVKRLPASAGDERDACSIPGSGRSAGGGPGHPLQCSCLENAIDRGAWRATVQRVSQSRTRLKGLSSHARAEGGGTVSKAHGSRQETGSGKGGLGWPQPRGRQPRSLVGGRGDLLLGSVGL